MNRKQDAIEQAALAAVNAACDQGRDYYREHTDDMLIAVARHAATLFPVKLHQIAFLQGYRDARVAHDAFKRGE